MTDHTGTLPPDGMHLTPALLDALMVYVSQRPDSTLEFEVAP